MLFGPDISISKRHFDLVSRRRFNRFWNPLCGMYSLVTRFPGLSNLQIPSFKGRYRIFYRRIDYGLFIILNFLKYSNKIFISWFCFELYSQNREFLGIESMKCFSFSRFICTESL
jgi:hypothetical protein